MEIVKELNLNGNPQNVKNGSLVYGQNIRLSADGSFITNDEGFKIGVIKQYTILQGNPILKVNGVNAPATEQHIDGNIVGNINCPNEIVIFTDDNKIYRLVECENYDELCVVRVDTGWSYNYGKIVGTFIYNVNNELIISIGESDAIYDVPLYTINLNKSTINDYIEDYSIAPNIPIANLINIKKVLGTQIPNGVYYFFIRYAITAKDYTNWFPIGGSNYALHLENAEVFNHKYPIEAEHDNTIGTTTAATIVNTNKDSNYNFNFDIVFDGNYSFKKFQIGYILQTNNAIVARKWKEFKISDTLSYNITFDNKNISEVSIDEIIKQSFNIYNVKSLTNFENKLYIANFKETNYDEDLQEYADNIKALEVIKPITTKQESFVNRHKKVILHLWDNTISDWTTQSSIETIVDYFDEKVPVSELSDAFSSSLFDLLEGNGKDTDLITTFGNAKFNITQNYHFIPTRIKGGFFRGGNIKNISTTTTTRNNKTFWIVTYTLNNDKIVVLNTSNFIFSYEFVDEGIVSYNADNSIKSLMPNEVYSFYIHYVRKDGTYTNGYKISNNYFYKQNSLNPSQIDYISYDTNAGSDYGNYTYFELANMNIGHLLNINDNTIKENIANLFNIWDANNNDLFNWLKTEEFSKIKLCEVSFTKTYLLSTRIDTDLNIENYRNFNLYINSNGDKLFKTTGACEFTDTDDYNYLNQIGVQFNGITIPDDYVGYFISYEKPESLNLYNAIVNEKDSYTTSGTQIYFNVLKASESEFALTNYKGQIFVPQYKVIVSNADTKIYGLGHNDRKYIDFSNIVISNGRTNIPEHIVDREGLEGGIIVKFYNGEYINDVSGNEKTVGSVIILNNNIYTNENKELIPLGYIKSINSENYDSYGEDNKDINFDINYPSFICEDKYVKYKDPVEIDDSTGNVYKAQYTSPNARTYTSSNYARIINYYKHCTFNLNAITFKKEPEILVHPYGDEFGYVHKSTFVKPINASDLFELKSDYFYNQYKAYSKYNEDLNYENVTPNMIRSSYPIRTESNENSWRQFDADDYYLIDKKSGEIINIFGTGKYFFIHTRNTLLIASSDAKLTADNTTISVINHKLFDVAPSELFTSDLGYGGIKHRDCHILSNYGYIWYDTDHHKVFRYDNSKLEDLTASIQELIDNIKPEYCYFNLDNKTNRIFMCFITPNVGGLTLAYSTLTNTFISVMDFGFDKNMHTTNNIYFARSGISEIYKYDVTNFGLYELLGKLKNVNTPVDDTQASFDIIINIGPELPKSLESIRWIHSYLADEYMSKQNYDNYAELKPAYLMNRLLTKHPDEKIYDLANVYIRIYNNNVDTGELSLFNDKLNRETIKRKDGSDYDDGYKYPHYEKGVWQFNYFRDNITQDRATTPSDMKSLIYGTYFVIRFTFKNKRTVEEGEIHNKKLKFDSISTKINNY